MEIKWTDTDPETGERRFVAAEKFAGKWQFRYRFTRRGEWTRGLQPTRDMWEHVLEMLQNRYQRREGVDEKDIKDVQRILKEWRDPPSLEE